MKIVVEHSPPWLETSSKMGEKNLWKVARKLTKNVHY